MIQIKAILGMLFSLNVMVLLATIPLGIFFYLKGKKTANQDTKLGKQLLFWPLMSAIGLIVLFILISIASRLMTA